MGSKTITDWTVVLQDLFQAVNRLASEPSVEQMSGLLKKIPALEVELEEKGAELRRRTQRIDELEKFHRASSQNQLDNYNESRDKMAAKEKKLQAEVFTLQKDIREKDGTISHLQSQENDLKQEVQKATDSLKRGRENLKQSNEKITKLEKELKKQNDVVNRLTGLCDQQKDTIARLEGSKKDLSNQISDLHKGYEEVRDKLTSLRAMAVPLQENLLERS